MEQKILHGNNIELLKTFPDNYFHSIVTDPPYGLNFMGKKWDYQVPSIEFWREALRVLKPGGYVLSFCGTRTYHRMVVNIEDAGFEIRDCIQWIYGSGFPKSLNVSKAIDDKLGAERKVVGKNTSFRKLQEEPSNYNLVRNENITAPSSIEAKQWDGWGTALKPANEPICVARKPVEGTVAENVLKHGTGGINIDASRIKFDSEADRKSAIFGRGTNIIGGNYVGATHSDGRENIEPNDLGRFPANIIFDEEAAKVLDLQTGILTSGKPVGIKKASNNIYGKYAVGQEITGFGDSGGASRFFYIAKASKAERSYGLGEIEEQKIDKGRKEGNPGGDNPRNRGVNKVKNFHPTVKPISLMKYLVRLVTPKNGIVLDPFNGSGTTGIACKCEGFNYVGMEMDKEYCDISEARIAAWTPETDIYDLPEKEIKIQNQTSLF